MFPLKPITASGIPGALQKVERYRLLHDPAAAESICLDILEIEPDHQTALVMLLLARTDQLTDPMSRSGPKAKDVLPRITDEYTRCYYAGVIRERQGNALLHSARPGTSSMAYDAFREAMEWYERAERIRPDDNDDALLRWNTCARILNANRSLAPEEVGQYEPTFED